MIRRKQDLYIDIGNGQKFELLVDFGLKVYKISQNVFLVTMRGDIS